jgi:3-dehydroquinate synthase
VNTESALDEFRQHLGGQLTITLVKGIGQSQEVDYIDTAVMQKSIDSIAGL